MIICYYAVTSRAQLDLENLSEIMKCIWLARHKYYEIGIALGIDATTLEVIKMENLRIFDRYIEVIKMWLRRGKPVPCWALLAERLSSLMFIVEVKEIEKGKVF